MFGKIKKALGIEGVKIELLLPEEVLASKEMVIGKIKFTSLSDQVVGSIDIKMIERYARGKKDNRRIDEYVIGEIKMSDEISVKPNQIVEVDFELPFAISKSEMDKLEDSNFMAKGVVKLAKYFKKVSSDYRIEATADVKGTKFDPTAKKVLTLK